MGTFSFSRLALATTMGFALLLSADATHLVARRRTRLVLMALLILALPTCDSPPQASAGGIAHPAPAHFLFDADNVVEVGKSSRSSRSLSLGAPSFHVGELDGPSEYVLGSIDAVARTDSTIVLLDSRSHLVRLFDHQGRFVTSAGGPGQGPGEFVRPNAMTIDSLGSIFVTDVRAMRLNVFRYVEDSVKFATSAPLTDVMPYDVCALSGSIVVHGVELRDPQGSRQVHVFDPDLSYRRSFGRVYDSGNSTIQNALTTGQMLCVPPSTVVYAPANLPFVFAYSITGETLWISRLSDFVPFPYVEYPDRIVNPIPDGGAHASVSLARACEGWLVVQVAQITTESARAGQYSGLDTYALEVATGEGLYLGDDLPFVVDSNESVALAKEDQPFPRIEVRPVEWTLECGAPR